MAGDDKKRKFIEIVDFCPFAKRTPTWVNSNLVAGVAIARDIDRLTEHWDAESAPRAIIRSCRGERLWLRV